MMVKRGDESHRPHLVGWKERGALPDLGIPLIKIKVDTGARTSSLHAFDIQLHERDGREIVTFGVHPRRRDEVRTIRCTSEVLAHRIVTNSGGSSEERVVIRTSLRLGKHLWPIELNLTDRSTLGYRMLLGRTALHERFCVDPSSAWQQGNPLKSRGKP